LTGSVHVDGTAGVICQTSEQKYIHASSLGLVLKYFSVFDASRGIRAGNWCKVLEASAALTNVYIAASGFFEKWEFGS
jgi:hypothetical protein